MNNPNDSTRKETAKPERALPSASGSGSAAGVKYPKGVCIVCGSVLLIQYWRGHMGNQRIHCNDCGSEVTPLMHAKKQPNSEIRRGGPETLELKPQRNPPLPASNG